MRNIHKTAATLAGLVSVAVILFTSTPASAQSSTPQGAQILTKVYPDFVNWTMPIQRTCLPSSMIAVRGHQHICRMLDAVGVNNSSRRCMANRLQK